MKIELGKKYQTRSGLAVRIICIDGPGKLPVVGAVEGENRVDSWLADGKYWGYPDHSSYRDLIPSPEKHEAWVVVGKESPYVGSRLYFSREEALIVVKAADKAGREDETHCVAHLEWEE